jgi:hypothetical protein
VRIGGLGFHAPFALARMRIAAAEEHAAPAGRAREEGADLRRFAELLRELRGALASGAERVAGARGRGRAGAIRLHSEDGLGLGTGAAPAVLRSSEEVNTVPTSYTPFGPSFSGLSQPLPTIDGVYDGDQGDDTLTFRVTRAGSVGSTSVRVDVFDSTGTNIDRLTFAASYVPGTPIALANGLTLALGAGLTVLDDEFQVDVSTSVGSAVISTNPFDGTRNQRPNFEPGLAVTAGSFQVNGVTIAVSADDTLAEVLASITASAAGVTASFDAASEKVILTHGTPGADGQITVGGDTSGFLAATKLDSAVLEPGRDDDPERPIAEVPALAAISSGTLTIDGLGVTFDVTTDSLLDVIERINALPLDVVASFDYEREQLVLASPDTLTLDDGGTDFFATLGIAAGEHARRAGARRGFSAPGEVRGSLEELARAWSELFGARLGGVAGHLIDRLRDELVAGVREVFEERLGSGAGRRLRSRLGLDLETGGTGGPALQLDPRALERTLRDDAAGLTRLLLGDDGEGGLLAALEDATRSTAGALGSLLERHGLSFVDVEA